MTTYISVQFLIDKGFIAIVPSGDSSTNTNTNNNTASSSTTTNTHPPPLPNIPPIPSDLPLGPTLTPPDSKSPPTFLNNLTPPNPAPGGAPITDQRQQIPITYEAPQDSNASPHKRKRTELAEPNAYIQCTACAAKWRKPFIGKSGTSIITHHYVKEHYSRALDLINLLHRRTDAK
jgi:hypothetical protein